MKSLWDLYGISMDTAWNIDGISIWSLEGTLQNLCGISMESLWNLCRISIGPQWDPCRIIVGHLWNLIWDLHVIFVGSLWNIM